MYNDPKKFLFMSMRKWDYRGEGGGGWVIRMVIFLSCLCFLFLLTYPRLTLIIIKKFSFKDCHYPFKFSLWFTDSFRIAIVPIACLVYKSRQLSRMWPFSLLHKVVSPSYMPHFYI